MKGFIEVPDSETASVQLIAVSEIANVTQGKYGYRGNLIGTRGGGCIVTYMSFDEIKRRIKEASE